MSHRPNFRSLLIALTAIALALSVSACGIGNKPKHPLSGSEDGTASSGFYVDAGYITYQVQLSRELNPYAPEDETYLRGIPGGIKAAQDIPASDEWLGVFLWAKNQSKVQAKTAGTITISDTLGNVYKPTPINGALNPLAYAPTILRPQQDYPLADSLASTDAEQGTVLLFLVNDSVYSNRPLTLNIYPHGLHSKPAQVSLDL